MKYQKGKKTQSAKLAIPNPQKLLRENPHLELLEEVLLDIGGKSVTLMPEPYLNQILNRGQICPANKIERIRGDKHQCHRNSARLWFAHYERNFQMASGWALGGDGVWFQHSWGWYNGSLIETTVPWEVYFGYRLNPDEAFSLFRNNTSIDVPGPVRSVKAWREVLGFSAANMADIDIERFNDQLDDLFLLAHWEAPRIG